MKKTILKNLHGQVKNLPRGKNIFVLKGVPLSFVSEENFPEDLERAADNPLKYFIEFTNSNRKSLSYEEFSLLSAFILLQTLKSLIVLTEQ